MKLLIKNKPNTYQQGSIIGVFDDAHVFGRNESKAQFLAFGGLEDDWPRDFVVVNITNADSADYQYLLDRNSNLEMRYFINPPTPETELYQALAQNGEITTTKAVLDSMIIDTGE